MTKIRIYRIGFAAAALFMLSACSALVSRAASGFAENLSQAILDQNDPETVRDGAPAYLLLMDGLVQGSPESGLLLEAAAKLYAAYGAVFVEDEARAQRLSSRAINYGERALCQNIKAPPSATPVIERPGGPSACGWPQLTYDEFTAALDRVDKRDVSSLHSFTISWLAWARAHSSDWVALADLPKIEASLIRIRELDESYDPGSVHLYLGIINTLRPPALGGRPEVGREHFERAIKLSDGRDLSAKVEFAKSYARMLYDRELHDHLLAEVVKADVEAPGLTLLNVLAKRSAEQLLADADEYF